MGEIVRLRNGGTDDGGHPRAVYQDAAIAIMLRRYKGRLVFAETHELGCPEWRELHPELGWTKPYAGKGGFWSAGAWAARDVLEEIVKANEPTAGATAVITPLRKALLNWRTIGAVECAARPLFRTQYPFVLQISRGRGV